MGAVNTGAAKGKVLQRESSAFCVADIVVVVVETSRGPSRIWTLCSLGRLDLGADLREEVFEIGGNYRARLYQCRLQGVDTVSEVGKVLGGGIVGPAS